MYDSLLWARDKGAEHSTIRKDLGVKDTEYLLATVHRPRNTDDRERLETILASLAADPRPVIFSAHPRTIDRLEQYDLLEVVEEDLRLIDPVGYLDFVMLQAGAEIIVTDSGGIQKEAFFLDIPCITLREETEWPETVDAGGNILVGADADAIRKALENPPQLSTDAQPYGDGTAGKQIAQILTELSH